MSVCSLAKRSQLGSARPLFNIYYLTTLFEPFLHNPVSKVMSVQTNTTTHPIVYILSVLHLILDIHASFQKSANPFQILKGNVFLITDIQVRISIWCRLTSQTWVAVSWVRREDKTLGAGDFQGQRAHWGGRGMGRGGGGAIIHMQCRRPLCINPVPPRNPWREGGWVGGW